MALEWINVIELGTLIAAVLIHEIGHWLTFKIAGYKAKIKLTWFGLSCGDNINLDKVPPGKLFGIAGMGIWFGLFAVHAIDALGNYYGWFNIVERIYWLYALMCCMDIAIMMQILDKVFKRKKK